MDDELDLARYLAGLRRRARLIAAVAAVGAILGGLLGLSGADDRVMLTLKPVARGAELAAVSIDMADLDLVETMESLIFEMETTDFEDEVSAAVGTAVDVTAVGAALSTRPAIDISVEAEGEAALEAAVAAIVERASESFASSLSVKVDGVLENSQALLDLVTKRLDELSDRIASTSDDDVFLIEGTLIQEEKAQTQIDAISSRIVAVEAYKMSLGSDLQVFGQTEPVPVSSVPKLAIVGLVLGAVLAAGAALTLTIFDRKVRSRRDVERLGLGSLVGVVPVSPDRDDARSLAAALNHLSNQLTSAEQVPRIQLVPLGGADLRSLWYPEVESLFNPGRNFELAESVATAALQTSAHESATVNVVAVPWGACDRSDLSAAANRLAAAGSERVGVVLYGVPRSEMKAVEA